MQKRKHCLDLDKHLSKIRKTTILPRCLGSGLLDKRKQKERFITFILQRKKFKKIYLLRHFLCSSVPYEYISIIPMVSVFVYRRYIRFILNKKFLNKKIILIILYHYIYHGKNIRYINYQHP